jgi:hypothetical protein
MANLELATCLVATLPRGIEGLFNPWAELCPEDLDGNGPTVKLQRLAAHLDCQPAFIVCGEAGGYQGCRHSGMAFTSERLLLEGAIPRVNPPAERLTTRNRPYSEPSATIVWKALNRLGIAEHTVLWNALQMHPYKEGNIRSNRTPTQAEIALGDPGMRILVKAFPKAKIVAVGRKAEGLLHAMGIRVAGAVRHPANGGATEFANGMHQMVMGACRISKTD